MRSVTRWLLVAGVTALSVSSVLAQGQGGFPGFGGPGRGTADPASLLRNPQVIKELDLSEEQLKQVPEAVMDALSKVLEPKQMKRLQQIQLQQRGVAALQDARVQKQLNLTADQKETISTIMDESAKELKEMMEGARQGGNFREVLQKVATMRKETNERVREVLTDTQKKQWEDMQGEEFKMEFRFGGGRPGGQGSGDGEANPRRPRNRQPGEAPRKQDT
jgi:hypothetical protein